jgi:adenylate kinase
MAKVFINHVDQYSGNVIGNLFSESIVGGTSEQLEGEEEGEVDLSAEAKFPYTVIGTMKDSTAAKPDFVDEVVQVSSREELLTTLIQCDIVIYDICEDSEQVEEARWAVQALHGEMGLFSQQKVFICMSTVLTWARTKPLDPEDPEIPFTEEDYRKRRPHPNFKEQVAVEKLVIKLGKTNKDKLSTYVVASGLTYGCGEDIFHFFFKAAWLGDVPALPVFGNGQNIVPTIHIQDLASVLLNVADGRPATRYLVAVDGGQVTTLEEIVKTISSKLGNDKVKSIPKDDALFYKDLKQKDYDKLLVNLRIEATFVRENMQIDWVAETGLVDSIEKAIKEYKETRGLLPLRVCILGPPQVGKSLVAAQICERFKLHHIKIQDVIQEELNRLEESAARANAEDIDEQDDALAQKDAEYLGMLQESKENNNGKYEDQHVIAFFRRKLKSMPCQNQGFVLDGYPKTYGQAKELFASKMLIHE